MAFGHGVLPRQGVVSRPGGCATTSPGRFIVGQPAAGEILHDELAGHGAHHGGRDAREHERQEEDGGGGGAEQRLERPVGVVDAGDVAVGRMEVGGDQHHRDVDGAREGERHHRFPVGEPQEQPQAFGLESVELRVAGHAGSSPRPLAKVASGGELSRLALAIAVTTAREEVGGAATLIFDEIDAGVGGTVADSVGRLMKQLGRSAQVLAVTHLAQVAACADHHVVVSKSLQASRSMTCTVP